MARDLHDRVLILMNISGRYPHILNLYAQTEYRLLGGAGIKADSGGGGRFSRFFCAWDEKK